MSFVSPYVNDDPGSRRLEHRALRKLLAGGDGDLVGVEQHVVVVHDVVPQQRRKQDLMKRLIFLSSKNLLGF